MCKELEPILPRIVHSRAIDIGRAYQAHDRDIGLAQFQDAQIGRERFRCDERQALARRHKLLAIALERLEEIKEGLARPG